MDLWTHAQRWGMPGNWGEYPVGVLQAVRTIETAVQVAQESKAETERQRKAAERQAREG